MSSIRLYISEIQPRDRHGDRLGVSTYEIDANRGKLQLLGKFYTDAVTNMSCFDRDLLYVTAEETDWRLQRELGDRILVLKADPVSGLITEQAGEIHTLSPNPVYVSIDRERKFLFCASHTTHNAIHKLQKVDGVWKNVPMYDDATVLMFLLSEGGTAGELEAVAFQEGSGPLKTQTHAHPHSAVVSPSGNLLAVCDKGADKVFLYGIDRDKRCLTILGEPYRAEAGDEPRFCVFHSTQKWLYFNHEGNLKITYLRYTEEGGLTYVQTVDTMPDGFARQPDKIYEHQGIAMRPDGRYLYSVARGMDVIAVYRIHQDTGMLELLQCVPMQGDWPRCCCVSPDGNWLAAGDRSDGKLCLFHIDEQGRLSLSHTVEHDCGVHFISAAQRPV